MSEKSIPDFIQSILEEHKGFMKVKDLPAVMDFDTRRKLGFMKKNMPVKNIMKIIEPLIEDRFIFSKKGSVQYILVPCDPSEFVINSLSHDKPASPKVIARTLPFSKQDFINMLNELEESGKIRIILNENFEARIILSDIHEGHEESVRSIKTSGEYTREKFKKAFDELERGQTFVNLPELRKKLAWPHDVFDDMIRKLRDEGIIQLQKTEAGNFALEDFFYDEHGARRGMVRWHER
ncbi:MAG: hypothetical protein IJG55_11505 [Synergistaceae bacterium]|nr:hypothetical protein [Synergistaceae bacterium]